MFLKFKKSFQSLRSENSLRTDLEVSRHFLRTRGAKKIPKTILKTRNLINHVYFDIREIPCDLFSKPLNKGIFSVFGRFIEDGLRHLMC
jgi:hypothetical protein